MAINTTIGTPTPGSDPAVITNRITMEISNPATNTILAVGVGVSKEEAVTSISRTKLSRERLIAELDPQLSDAKTALAALDPNVASYEKRKASKEAEIAGYEKRIANANSDISAADEAIAYINSDYQTAIDQRVKEATQPAPVAVATPDSAAGESGNSENPPPAEATTSPVPNPNITANQESINEQDTYAEAQRKAAAAEAATQSSIEAGTKAAVTDPSAVRRDAAGVAAGAAPPSKNPGGPSVSVGGVKKEDMRVRIALAPQSPNIFYKDTKNDLLKPLKETDGVIFPIQPSITIGHEARYQGTDLTHSNFTFWNYQNSAVKPISLTGEFLIRNPREGRYCIAVIRFLQAMTKMFNANDTANNMKGAPPAVARLYGLGLMGFDSIPVVITSVDVTYGTDVDLLSLAVAVNGTTEVTKLPASFQITVTMNPVFSREFATNFFGVQDYASGKVRLLGKSVITPIVTTTPAVTTPATGTAKDGNVATANSTATNNMTKPDSNAGTSGNSAGTGDGVKPAATGSGTDSKNEETKEKTTTRNADGSTTEITTETVNGVKKVTTTTVDASGKSTTTVDGGASGTGAGTASTSANAAGNGGDSTQPKDEAAAASSIAAKKQATDDFIAQRDQIIAEVQSAYDGIKQAITDYSATYQAMLNRSQATSQADLATDQAELAAVQNGTMAFPTPGGFKSIAEIQQSIASEQNSIASRQAKIDAGAPYYGLSQDMFERAASTEPAYLSAKRSASDALANLSKLNSAAQGGNVEFNQLPNYSASWFTVPPEIKINGTKLT